MAASSKLALVGAMVANIAIAVTKIIVGALTNSSVMITEAVHSVVDTGNSGLMLLGRRRSKKPADEDHPFGYGMELYFWSFVVASVVFGAGACVSIYKGIRGLSMPEEATSLWVNYLVIAISALFEGTSLWISVREFDKYRAEKSFEGGRLEAIKASKNPAIFMSVLEDSAALLGLAIAAAGIALGHATGNHVWEGLASILIGLVLVGEALLLGYEVRELIIGEPARDRTLAKVNRTLARHRDELPIGDAKTLQLGPDAILVIVPLHEAPLEAQVAKLVADLRATVPQVKDVAFELSAAMPT